MTDSREFNFRFYMEDGQDFERFLTIRAPATRIPVARRGPTIRLHRISQLVLLLIVVQCDNSLFVERLASLEHGERDLLGHSFL